MKSVPTLHSALQSSREQRVRTVVCSPHFDDAVLDCWSVLDREDDSAVVNVFTGAPGGRFASWYDQLNGASNSAAHMHQRSLEDRAALAVAGKAAIDLDLLEVQYRLRQSPWLHALFRYVAPLRFAMLRLPLLRPALYRTPAPHPEQIADAIVRAMPGASHFCVPAGIGGHRDHLIVREAGVVLASRGLNVRMYADLPYAVRYGWPRWVDASDGQRSIDWPSLFWRRHLHGVGDVIGDPVREAIVVRLTPEESARKAAAFSRYATQIEPLNSGRTRGWLKDGRAFAYEVYWNLRGTGPAAC
jgi:hypothetical protein